MIVDSPIRGRDGASSPSGDSMVPALAIAALALGFCLFRLGGRSIWLDEAVSLRIAQAKLPAAFSDGGNMAFYYLFLKGWVRLGESEWLARLPSAVFSAGAVVLLFLLAKRLFDGPVAFIAALLLAVNSSVIRYGQEARGYALALLLVIAGWLFLVLAVERSGSGWFFLWGSSMALAVATHVLAVLVLAVQLASLMLLPPRRVHRPGLVAGSAVAVLGAVPVLALAANAGTAQIDWLPPASIRAFTQVLLFISGYNFEPSSELLPNLLNAVVLAASILGWSAGLWVAVRALRKSRRSWHAWASALPVAWLFAPLLASTVFSVTFHSLLAPRYFIALLPASCLLLAVAVSRVDRQTLMVGAVTLLAGLGVAGVIRSYGTAEWGWRGAADYLVRSAAPSDEVVVIPAYQRLPLDYYLQRSQATLTFASPKDGPWQPRKDSVFRVAESFYAPSIPEQAASLVADKGRFWLVSTDFTRWDRSGRVVEAWADAGAFFRGLGSGFRVRSGMGFDRIGILLIERTGASTRVR